MDARSFCAKHPVTVPKPDELIFAAIKTVGGGLLLWVGVRRIGTHHPLLTGWAGMAALVMMVHFGIFHLLSLFWRARGVAARPIMQSPFTATTLSRLWSRGWNTAFTDLMHTCLLKPAARGVGPAGAVSLVFVVSGLLHELVISVPARGGYGLPTAYFLTQGLGLLLERSKFGCKLGLGSGLRGWCFAALVAGGPAFWLFPPPFIYNVILPMLRAFGVIGGNL
jgi:alginate O-acetyltransferase complex protein AlgI